MTENHRTGVSHEKCAWRDNACWYFLLTRAIEHVRYFLRQKSRDGIGTTEKWNAGRSDGFTTRSSTILLKATVTPDRTIGCDLTNVRPIGKVCYDLQKRQTAIDRSFLLVVGHRTIGRTRGRAINTDWRRSMTRSIIS